MRKRLLPLCLTAAMALSGSALAADHLDSPSVMADPAGDINDVFAWVDDSGDVIVAMTVFPVATAAAQFSPSLQYVIHTSSAAGYGMAQTDTDIICTFDAAQTVQCWVGAGDSGDYVTGDASATAGLTSDSGDVQVFAGLRDDPFFFNLAGFQATIDIVKSAAAGLTFDDANCPTVDAGTSNVLVTQLASSPEGNAGQDFFAPLNTLSIVVKLDPGLVNAGGNTLAVWGSTRMTPAP